MIKVHKDTEKNNKIFYICNLCGGGISEGSPQENIDAFAKEHRACKHKKNTNLAFLDTDEEYKP